MKNNSKPTGNTFEIDSFEKLINAITPENIDYISADFYAWMKIVSDMFSSVKAKNISMAGRPNSELATVKFLWTDDGKHDKSIKFVSTESGKVVFERKIGKVRERKGFTSEPTNGPFEKFLQQDCGGYPLRIILDNLIDDQIEDAVSDLLAKAFEYAAENAQMIPRELMEDVSHWIDRDHMKSLAEKFKETL